MNSETRPSQKISEPRKWQPSGATQSQTLATIEAEARAYLESGHALTESSMRKSGRYDLINAVSRHYPGKIKSLRENISADTLNRKPNGYWKGEEGLENVRREALSVLTENGKLTFSLLNNSGRSDLASAISSYPGGMRQLKTDIGLMPYHRPAGYWTIDNIVKEAREQHELQGKITPNGVDGGLRYAIAHIYPGGWAQIRKDLGMDLHKSENNYWTKERVFERAQVFLQEHGKLDRKLMQQTKNTSLGHYISSIYPGGWSQLRQDLEQKVLVRQWPEEEILKEARKVLAQGGLLTHNWLTKNGMSAFAAAVDQKYPGRMKGLRQSFGVDFDIKPRGYWTTERIEQEALVFYKNYGRLTPGYMSTNGADPLSQAIRTKYQGGFLALKIKLGIISDDTLTISTNDANEQLKRLLEGEQD